MAPILKEVLRILGGNGIKIRFKSKALRSPFDDFEGEIINYAPKEARLEVVSDAFLNEPPDIISRSYSWLKDTKQSLQVKPRPSKGIPLQYGYELLVIDDEDITNLPGDLRDNIIKSKLAIL